jgi:hypothetical protein
MNIVISMYYELAAGCLIIAGNVLNMKDVWGTSGGRILGETSPGGTRNKSVFGSVFGWKMFHKTATLKLEYVRVLITNHYV